MKRIRSSTPRPAPARIPTGFVVTRRDRLAQHWRRYSVAAGYSVAWLLLVLPVGLLIALLVFYPGTTIGGR
jgi:hypothetical protein